MIKLYTRTGCPYCGMVLGVINEMDIDYKELEISNEANLDSLLEIGGKQQVPFLIDEDRNVSMYESSDIIEYLKKNYKK